MKILPIIVSSDLIPHILTDRKIRTRRIAKVTQFSTFELQVNPNLPYPAGKPWGVMLSDPSENYTQTIQSPWQVGDILYVREEYYAYGYWRPDGVTATGLKKWKFKGSSAGDKTTGKSEYFFSDQKGAFQHITIQRNTYRAYGWYKRLARFMPKSYARIFLEVTDMRLERLQDITASEAILEGIQWLKPENGHPSGYRHYLNDYRACSPEESFQSLWEKINGQGAWTANPWVWVVSFKRVSKPEIF